MGKQLELAFKIASKMDSSVIGNFHKTSEEMKKMQNNMRVLKEQENSLNGLAKLKAGTENARKTLIVTNRELVESSKKLQAMKKAYEDSGKTNKGLSSAIKNQEKVVNSLNKQVERQKNVFSAARSELERNTSTIEKNGTAVSKAKIEIEQFGKKEADLARASKIQAMYGENRVKREEAVKKAAQEAELRRLKEINKWEKLNARGTSLRNTGASLVDKGRTNVRSVAAFSVVGIGSLAAFTRASIETYKASAEVDAKLKANIETVHLYTNSFQKVDALNKFKQQQQEIIRTGSIYGGTMIKTAQSQLSTFQMNADQIGKILPKVMDLVANKKGSAATQEDVFNISNVVGKAMGNGDITALKRQGIIVDENVAKLFKKANADQRNIIMQKVLADNVGKVNQAMANTPEGKIKQAQIAMGEFKKEVGKAAMEVAVQLSPAITAMTPYVSKISLKFIRGIQSMIKAVSPFAKKIFEFAKAHPKLMDGLLKLVVGMVAFRVGLGLTQLAFGGLFGKIGKGIQLFSSFRKGMELASGASKSGKLVAGVGKAFPMAGKLGGGLAKLGPLLMNPWVIAGAVIVGIFVLLYKKSTWFRNGVNNAMKQIMPYVKQLGVLLKSILGRALSHIHKLTVKYGPVAQKVFNSMKPVLSAVGHIFTAVIISAIKTVINTIKLIWIVAKNVFKMIGAFIKTAVTIWKGIFAIFFAVFTGQWGKIPGIVKGVWEGIKGGVTTFIDAFKKMFTGLFDWFGKQWDNAKKLAGSIGSALNPGSWFGGGKGKNASGTNYWRGGLTSIAERGAELVRIPGQSPFLAQSEMMINLPRGTQILNNMQTRNTLGGRIDGLKIGVDNLKSKPSNNAGGDTFQISITSNQNPQDIARIVRQEIEKAQNKRGRTEM